MTHEELTAAGWIYTCVDDKRIAYIRLGEFIQIDLSNGGYGGIFQSFRMGEVVDEFTYRSQIAALAEIGEEKLGNGQTIREWALSPAAVTP